MMPNTSKVAIILPSRGLMFSRTAAEILEAAKPLNYKIFFSHRRPIPECFEEPTLRALADPSFTHLLFVEDDMVIPPRTFWSMLNMDKDVVACDYPVAKVGQGAVFKDYLGDVLFCGTGCLLVKRAVFDKLKQPYFRSDLSWMVLNFGKALKVTAMKRSPEYDVYGHHDITFCMKLHKANVPITLLDIKLGQRKLIALGKSGTNDGAHQIEEWSKIKPDFLLKRVKQMPLALETQSKLVTVDTPSGGVTTSKKHAASLVSQGMASYPEPKGFILDENEFDI